MTTEDKDMPLKNIIIISAIMIGIGGFTYVFLVTPTAVWEALMIFTAVMLWAYRLILRKLANAFQTKVLYRLENWYKNNLRIAFKGGRPYLIGSLYFCLTFWRFCSIWDLSF